MVGLIVCEDVVYVVEWLAVRGLVILVSKLTRRVVVVNCLLVKQVKAHHRRHRNQILCVCWTIFKNISDIFRVFVKNNTVQDRLLFGDHVSGLLVFPLIYLDG